MEGASERSLAKGGVIFCKLIEDMWNDFLMVCDSGCRAYVEEFPVK